MQLEKLMQPMFNWFLERFPNERPLIESAMNNAMQVGQQTNNPADVINSLKQSFSNTQYASNITPEVNNVIDSFGNKGIVGIFPHALSMAKELGVFNKLWSFWGGKM